MKSDRRAFTLVEMLAVLAIIGMMIGISIPVFNIIGADRGVRADILQLNGVLRLARQHAVMNRSFTYVVFVDHFPDVLDEHRHRAYAVLEGDANGPETFVSPWHLLSKGVFFAPVTSTSFPSAGGGDTGIDVIAEAGRRACPYPETGSDTQDLRMIRYSPDGRCMTFRDNQWRLTGQIVVAMAPGVLLPTHTVDISIPNRERAGTVVIASRTGLSSMRLIGGG